MSLGIQDTVHRLKSYNDSAFPILSVYFHPVKNGKSVQDQVRSFLDHNLSYEQKEEVAQNIVYVQGLMENYQPKYQNESLALFSGDNIVFEIIHLPYSVENSVTVDHSPHIQPLLLEESTYLRYLVVVVDRAKAKFFTLKQGVIENQDEVIDESVPQNVHPDTRETTRLTREDKINRHIQDHIHRHFQLISQKVADFVGNTPINGVVVGGHKNLIHKFERHLPKLLQDRIVGEFVAVLNGNINEIVEKSKEIISHQQATARREP